MPDPTRLDFSSYPHSGALTYSFRPIPQIARLLDWADSMESRRIYPFPPGSPPVRRLLRCHTLRVATSDADRISPESIGRRPDRHGRGVGPTYEVCRCLIVRIPKNANPDFGNFVGFQITDRGISGTRNFRIEWILDIYYAPDRYLADIYFIEPSDFLAVHLPCVFLHRGDFRANARQVGRSEFLLCRRL